MTVPDLMSTVYLLLGVTWPIIKQNVANIGNRQQCFDGDLRLANLAPTCSARSHGRVSCITVSISLFSWVCPSDCQLRSWLSNNISVYLFIGTLGKTKIPTTVAGNQTGPQGIDNTGDLLYGSWLGSKSDSTALSSDAKSLPDLREPCSRC